MLTRLGNSLVARSKKFTNAIAPIEKLRRLFEKLPKRCLHWIETTNKGIEAKGQYFKEQLRYFSKRCDLFSSRKLQNKLRILISGISFFNVIITKCFYLTEIYIWLLCQKFFRFRDCQHSANDWCFMTDELLIVNTRSDYLIKK